MNKNHFIYMVLFTLLCPIICADNYVIINQVMYDSPLDEFMNHSGACNGEYIELYNAGTSAVSLQGWVLSGDGASEKYTFAEGTILSANSYLAVACRRGTNNTFQLADLYGSLLNNNNYIILYQKKITLSNNGEQITLCNAQNDTIDQMYYDGESHSVNPARLYAANADNIAADSCVSLHRSWVEFDAEGKVVSGTSQWRTDRVSFGSSMLPYVSYYEAYLLGDQALPAGENYILSITPLDPTTRIDINDRQPSACSGVRLRSNLQYIDGIGRTDEIIAMGATPGKNDLVSVIDYNGKRHASRQWLPVVLQTEGQRTEIVNIQSQAQTEYEDDRPFLEADYENSARKRQTAQRRPGYGQAAIQTYGMNSANDQVRIYTVSHNSLFTDGTYYSTTMLRKTMATDEDGKSVTTFTDKSGRKILERRNNSNTYYVYDDMGRLRYILPNLSSSQLNNGNYDLDNSHLKATAYCYRYDHSGNMIYKRLPGCEPQYMVYDQLGQLVLKQDGNQRIGGKWTMCAYDSIGRNLYTAEIALEQTHTELVDSFANKWQVEHYGNNYSFPLAGTGYASRLLKNKNISVLTINYYDNYDYLNLLTTHECQELRFEQYSGYGLRHDDATGMLTGTRVYNLIGDSSFTANSYYYDTQGRVIQSRSTRNAGGYTITSTEYLFDGSVAQQLTEQGTEGDFVREHYRYTYDHAGRTKKIYYQLNNDPEITFSEFSYDSIGRMAQNLLHDYKDTVRYSYDIRGMLTETRNKHFSERLYYADNLPQSAIACYNGNISAAQITQADSVYTFAYTYDDCNRLLSSNRLTNYGTEYSEQFTYDEAGNILSLERFCYNRQIDDLEYDYGNEGNRLWSVTENGDDADGYNTIEYLNGDVLPDTTMRYDANGNLIYDADRGISVISYNILNLPDTIQFMNGNQIVNLYDAVGQKYKSVAYYNIAIATTPHNEIAHYTFDTDSVVYSVTEYASNIETFYTPTDTARRIHNTIGYYTDSTYFHYLKDHLGNVCAVVNSVADTLIQSTLYYVSGIPMAQSYGRDKQPYLYNGKEFIETHGLNTYDYGFRGYYSTIGRFTSIDPLSEQTPWQSPYSYAGNRFVNAVDWMGLGELTSFANGNIVHCIITDLFGNIIGGIDDGDENIYIDVDGKWNPNEGKEKLILVGPMAHSFDWYMSEGGGGGIGGSILSNSQVLNAIICAAMNGRLSITITTSFGLEVGDKFFTSENYDWGLYGNLMSFELGSITITNSMDNPITKFSYFGKNNRVKITQGFQLIIPTYEKSFNIYATDFAYVPMSTFVEHSLTKVSYISSSGDFNWNISFGMFLSISIEIIYANKGE